MATHETTGNSEEGGEAEAEADESGLPPLPSSGLPSARRRLAKLWSNSGNEPSLPLPIQAPSVASAPSSESGPPELGEPTAAKPFRSRWRQNLVVPEAAQSEPLPVDDSAPASSEPLPQEPPTAEKARKLRRRWVENLKFNQADSATEPASPSSSAQEPAPEARKGFRSRWRENLRFNRPAEETTSTPSSESTPEGRAETSVDTTAVTSEAPKKGFRSRWRDNLKYNRAPGEVSESPPSVVEAQESPQEAVVPVEEPKKTFRSRWKENLRFNKAEPVASPAPPAAEEAPPPEVVQPPAPALPALGTPLPVPDTEGEVAAAPEPAPEVIPEAAASEAPPPPPTPPASFRPTIRGARGAGRPVASAPSVPLELPPPSAEPDPQHPMGPSLVEAGELALGAPEPSEDEIFLPLDPEPEPVKPELPKVEPAPVEPPKVEPRRSEAPPPELPKEKPVSKPPVAAPSPVAPAARAAAAAAIPSGPTISKAPPPAATSAPRYVPTARSEGSKAAVHVSTPGRAVRTRPKLPKRLRVSLGSLSVFTRQFAVMVKSGVTIHQALMFYAEGGQEGQLPKVVDELAFRVASGNRLSQSLRHFPDVFSGVYVGLVEAAENSSQIDEIFEKLADLLERQDNLRKRVMATITYPAFLAVVSLCAIALFVYYILPMMAPMLTGMGVELPWPTRMLLSLRPILPAALSLGVLSALVSYYGKPYIAAFLRSSPRLQRWLDRSVLALPVLGEVVEKMTISRILYSLATMVDAGMVVSEALKRCGSVAGNKVIAERLEAARHELIDGKPFHEALGMHEVFPAGCIQMLCVGEETSNLDTTIRYAAKFYEDEVEQSLGRFAALIEPLVMGGMGIFVGFIVLSAVMPTVKMLENL